MPGVPDVTPSEAWAALKTDPDAVLVDVRTDAEWNFVGIPELAETGKQAVLIPWQVFPTMQVNDHFTEHLYFWRRTQENFGQEHKFYGQCKKEKNPQQPPAVGPK